MAVSPSVEAELALLGATESVEGQVALRLAEQLDAPRNGMAVAGDAARLLTVMEAIRSRPTEQGDGLDELVARRRKRFAAS